MSRISLLRRYEQFKRMTLLVCLFVSVSLMADSIGTWWSILFFLFACWSWVTIKGMGKPL